jgi:hypothetical protein
MSILGIQPLLQSPLARRRTPGRTTGSSPAEFALPRFRQLHVPARPAANENAGGTYARVLAGDPSRRGLPGRRSLPRAAQLDRRSLRSRMAPGRGPRRIANGEALGLPMRDGFRRCGDRVGS